ncbi:Glycosyl transferase family 2 [Catalinimonas alkaloidigena]|uniref:Glycosyl transferase family 2 n=1 Tax=Catalinimonas alkaloidigena TaxID=1075417 RepID=A0A1G9LDT2_9BACT|nr:glycosyltransferase [Catalinimonas alkaloidigena]SDL60101.1 Glycosyl transferase family 2 [Catalinimonas alkaloidigena]
MPSFTLVSTVFNESQRLAQSIEDLENQSVAPAEIVITDAGSKDGTYEQLLEWASRSKSTVKILQKVGCNVAEGRNLAIQEATQDIIVSTDFGCRFDAEWLASLTTPFHDPEVQVVGGNYTVLEKDQKTLAAKAAYVLSGGYQYHLDDTFIPSSRSIAYRKDVWRRIGGYPEWLTLAADDLVFGKLIRQEGISIYLVQEAHVYWGRHTTLPAYGKEAFRYGLGDGEARVNQRSFVSNSVETLLRYGLLLAALDAGRSLVMNQTLKRRHAAIIPLLSGLRSYRYAYKNWSRFRKQGYSAEVLATMLRMIETTRYNYIKGYLRGYLGSSALQKEEARKLQKRLS